MTEIIEFVESGKRLEIPKDIPPRIASMISNCWHKLPANRPKFSEIAKELEKILESLSSDDNNNNNSTPLSPRNSFPSNNGKTSPNTSLSNSGGNNSNIFPPKRDWDRVGWWGSLPRPETERKLSVIGLATGTFLTRWSENTQSFVLSYRGPKNHIVHIGHIDPIGTDGSVVVAQEDRTQCRYPSLLEYVKSMQAGKMITQPLQQVEVNPTDIYALSPSVHQ